MTELMCVCVGYKMVTIVVSQLSFIHASLGNDDNCKMLHPKKETILQKHVDGHSHSETKRMTQ